MVSEAKTATHQLDLLMEALKTSIRKALDEDLSVEEAPTETLTPADAPMDHHTPTEGR